MSIHDKGKAVWDFFTNPEYGALANAANIGDLVASPGAFLAEVVIPGGPAATTAFSEPYGKVKEQWQQTFGGVPGYITREITGRSPASDTAATPTQPTTTPQLLRSEDPLAFFNRTQGRAAGGSGVGGQVAALQKSAEDYWKRMQNYATARSQALGSAYSGLAGSTARQAASVAQGGLNTAAAIENIYANLAKDAAQLARGGGSMVTPRTATAGLVPVSGEMLAAQQEIPAAGASLANYLSDTMGVQAGALDALARSQAAYGTASVADFLDRFNVARLADERNVANQIAKLRAAAAARGSALDQKRLEAEAAALGFTQRANEWVNAYRLADPKGEYRKAVDAAAARFGVSPETVAAELANNEALRIQLVPGMSAVLGS